MNWIKQTHFKWLLAILFLQMSLIVIVHGSARGADPDPAQPAEAIPGSSPETLAEPGNCRYGVATLGSSQVDWVDDLKAGWYLSFGTSTVPAPNNAEFVPVVTVKQNKTSTGAYLPSYSVIPALNESELGWLVDNRPGKLWIIGNEVDRGPDPGQIAGGQGDTYPDVYARAYHEVYHFIKGRDPSAQIAPSALVQVTPGRLQYLDLFWQAYKNRYGTAVPVDVWNMHVYILPEANPSGQPNSIANIALGTDPALAKRESGNDPNKCPLDNIYCIAEHDNLAVFAQQVVAMRTWMANRGYRHTPLILSEFSLLYPYQIDPGGTCWLADEYGNCFTPARVTAFLNNAFNYLESATDPNLGYPLDGNRLVQQWLWFSVNNEAGVGNISDLITYSNSQYVLSQVGTAFRNYVQGRPTSINLFPDGVSYPVAFAGGGGTANVILSATLRNNGNKAPINQFFVTFYANAALTQPIGSATVEAPSAYHSGMAGCARQQIKVSVNWNNLPPGLHRYWVKVDSSGVVAESNEGDNVRSGFVIINPFQVYLPLSQR
jgi:hypothetical protein